MSKFTNSVARVFGFSKDNQTSEPNMEVRANGEIIDAEVKNPSGDFHGVRTATFKQSSRYNTRTFSEFKSEYDLPTIANAIFSDGLLQRSVNIYIEQILKNGFTFVSKNDKLNRHVNNRINEIQYLTGISTYELFNEISWQLVAYSNCFIIKVRSETKSEFGRRYDLYSKEKKPIVGLFVVDATTMKIALDNKGQIDHYTHEVKSFRREFNPEDVIHITYNKIPGTLSGTPIMLPILDDVRAMRKLEEELEIMGFQYAIPLYLYKVGTPEKPPGPNEINRVSAEVNNMPSYGMLVVPGHHSIEVPARGTDTVDLVGYVNHFKRRALSGIGISPIAYGDAESANRNTSEVLDLSMQTITKRYQNLIKNKIDTELLSELALDGGFDRSVEASELSFPEIDLEAQVKKENAIVQLWLNNLISLEEARLELDREKNISKNTYLNLVKIPEIQATAAAKAALAPEPAEPNKKANATKNKPQNQHGKSSGPPKFKKDEFDDIIANSLVIRDNMLTSPTDFSIYTFKERAIKLLMDYVQSITSEYKDDEQKDIIGTYIASITTLVNDKYTRMSKNKELSSPILEHSSESIIDLLKDQEEKIANLLVLLENYKSGYKSILIDTQGCELHNNTTEMMVVDKFEYLKLPPLVPECKCHYINFGN